MNTPHPELEELAALIDSDAETSADTAPNDVRTHVAGCAQCTADLGALRDVRSRLRSLPPVPMPDDVAQRLEAALRDAAAEFPADDAATGEQPAVAAISVLPAGGSVGRSGRRGSSSGLPNFSVAAAVTVFLVIALGVGLGIGLSHGSSSKKGSSSTAAGAGASAIVTASGTDYSQGAIRNQVAGLLLANVPAAHTEFKGLAPLAADASSAAATAANAAPAAAPSAPAASSAQATPSSSASSPVSSPARSDAASQPSVAGRPALQARTPFSGPLSNPTQLQACVQALLDQPATPVLVDYAYYAGKPATIIVLRDPTDPSTLDVYVEADTADCAKAGDVTFVAFLRDVS